MSRNIQNSIKYSACKQRTDHSEKVENKIKEVVVLKLSAIVTLDITNTGVILWKQLKKKSQNFRDCKDC